MSTLNQNASAAGIRHLGALLLFLLVALGAMGGHAFEDRLATLDRQDTWETAVFYHGVHGLAMLLLGAVLPPSRGRLVAAGAFFLGVLLFSGSLYALSLTNIGTFGAITPFGGIAFLVGWGAVLLARDPAP